MSKILDVIAVGIVGSTILTCLGFVFWALYTTYLESPAPTVRGLIGVFTLIIIYIAFERVGFMLGKHR